MKLVKILFLLFLVVHSSGDAHDTVSTGRWKQALLGMGLLGYGGYGFYTRNKLYKMGSTIDLNPKVQRSLYAARLQPFGKVIGAAALAYKYYNNKLKSAQNYVLLKK
jgi:hypothetical protein